MRGFLCVGEPSLVLSDRISQLPAPRMRADRRASARVGATAQDDDATLVGEIAVGRDAAPARGQVAPAAQERLERGRHDRAVERPRGGAGAKPLGERPVGGHRAQSGRAIGMACVRAGGQEACVPARVAQHSGRVVVAPQQGGLEVAAHDRLDRGPGLLRSIEPVEKERPAERRQAAPCAALGAMGLGQGVELGPHGAQPLAELDDDPRRRVGLGLGLLALARGRLERLDGRAGLPGGHLRGMRRAGEVAASGLELGAGTLAFPKGVVPPGLPARRLLGGARRGGDPIALP
ncbi:MAG TPA: hypothetical protein VNT23_06795 [Gaiellaceae bacterium]|nr:hypothetical protein [Gaiellaceae bacterium]